MPESKYQKEHSAARITDIYIDTKDGYGSWHIIAVRSEMGYYDSRYDVYSRYEKIEIVKIVVTLLDETVPNFLDLFADADSKSFAESPNRRRRYISKDKSQLYPTKTAKFTSNHPWGVRDYWIGTNVGEKEIRQYLVEIGEAAGGAHRVPRAEVDSPNLRR